MKYLFFVYMALKKRLVYRFDMAFGYLLVLLSGVASRFFWAAMENAGKIPPNDSQRYITYSIITTILGSIFTSDLIMTVGEKVRMGQIVSDLQKPMDFQAMSIADSFGGTLGSLILDFIPKFIIMKVVIGIYMPHSLTRIALFLLSCLLGYLMLITIDYLISLLAFYFVEVWAFWVVKGVVVGFCSGLYLPLWLYPEKILKIINVLPFKDLYYVPVNIYLSNMDMKETMYSLLVQLCWLAALFAAGKLATLVVVRKLTIAGG